MKQMKFRRTRQKKRMCVSVSRSVWRGGERKRDGVGPRWGMTDSCNICTSEQKVRVECRRGELRIDQHMPYEDGKGGEGRLRVQDIIK